MRFALALLPILALAACNGGNKAGGTGGNSSAPVQSSAPVAGAAAPAGKQWTDVVEKTKDNGFRQGNPNPENISQNFFALYAQDTWRAGSKLTVNFGLRWNPFMPMQFDLGDVYTFSLDKYYQGVRSTVIPTAPAGFNYPGDPGFNGNAGMDRHWGNVEPRAGFAWDLSGEGTMVIRASGSIANDFIRQDLHENTSSVTPFRLNVAMGGVRLDNPYATFAGGNPFPYTYDPQNPVFPTQIPFQNFFPIPPDLKTTTQYSWNVGVQRQITSSLFASATGPMSV